jgi:hypothetical protein
MNAQTLERTLNIPQNRRLTFQVPAEVPVGPADILFIFRPVTTSKQSSTITASSQGAKPAEALTERDLRDIEIINANAEKLNAEAADVLSYQAISWDEP